MTGFSDLVAASAESLLTQDLRVRAGATWSRSWTILDNTEDPIDFTGGTATFKVKDQPGGVELVNITETLVGGKQVVLSNGTIALAATAGATAPLVAGPNNYHGVYELRVTKSGETVSLVYGKITIYPTV